MKTTIIVHFVARSHHIVCKSYILLVYRVSIKSFPDYKYSLQENYVEYKHIFFFKL